MTKSIFDVIVNFSLFILGSSLLSFVVVVFLFCEHICTNGKSDIIIKWISKNRTNRIVVFWSFHLLFVRGGLDWQATGGLCLSLTSFPFKAITQQNEGRDHRWGSPGKRKRREQSACIIMLDSIITHPLVVLCVCMCVCVRGLVFSFFALRGITRASRLLSYMSISCRSHGQDVDNILQNSTSLPISFFLSFHLSLPLHAQVI